MQWRRDTRVERALVVIKGGPIRAKRTSWQSVSWVLVRTTLFKDQPQLYSNIICKSFIVLGLCALHPIVPLRCFWWCAARIEFAERLSSQNPPTSSEKLWETNAGVVHLHSEWFESTLNLFLRENFRVLRNAYVAHLCDHDKYVKKVSTAREIHTKR